jgi:hypothetical protein
MFNVSNCTGTGEVDFKLRDIANIDWASDHTVITKSWYRNERRGSID